MITGSIQDDLQSFGLITAIDHGGCTRPNSWPETWWGLCGVCL